MPPRGRRAGAEGHGACGQPRRRAVGGRDRGRGGARGGRLRQRPSSARTTPRPPAPIVLTASISTDARLGLAAARRRRPDHARRHQPDRHAAAGHARDRRRAGRAGDPPGRPADQPARHGRAAAPTCARAATRCTSRADGIRAATLRGRPPRGRAPRTTCCSRSAPGSPVPRSRGCGPGGSSPALALALPAAAAAQAAPPEQTTPPQQTPQTLFTGLIVNDPRTSADVTRPADLRRRLRRIAAAASPTSPATARMDALVQVRIPGAAGDRSPSTCSRPTATQRRPACAPSCAARRCTGATVAVAARHAPHHGAAVRARATTSAARRSAPSAATAGTRGRSTMRRTLSHDAPRAPARYVRRRQPLQSSQPLREEQRLRARNAFALIITARVQYLRTCKQLYSTQATAPELAGELLALWHHLHDGPEQRRCSRLLDELDLSMTAVKTLDVARRLRQRALRQGALRAARALAPRRAAATVDALLRRGCLERREDEHDRRVKRVADHRRRPRRRSPHHRAPASQGLEQLRRISHPEQRDPPHGRALRPPPTADDDPHPLPPSPTTTAAGGPSARCASRCS